MEVKNILNPLTFDKYDPNVRIYALEGKIIVGLESTHCEKINHCTCCVLHNNFKLKVEIINPTQETFYRSCFHSRDN